MYLFILKFKKSNSCEIYKNNKEIIIFKGIWAVLIFLMGFFANFATAKFMELVGWYPFQQSILIAQTNQKLSTTILSAKLDYTDEIFGKSIGTMDFDANVRAKIHKTYGVFIYIFHEKDKDFVQGYLVQQDPAFENPKIKINIPNKGIFALGQHTFEDGSTLLAQGTTPKDDNNTRRGFLPQLFSCYTEARDKDDYGFRCYTEHIPIGKFPNKTEEYILILGNKAFFYFNDEPDFPSWHSYGNESLRLENEDQTILGSTLLGDVEADNFEYTLKRLNVVDKLDIDEFVKFKQYRSLEKPDIAGLFIDARVATVAYYPEKHNF